jgi:hypothetical protein
MLPNWIELFRTYFDGKVTAQNPNNKLPVSLIHSSRKRFFSKIPAEGLLQDFNEILNRLKRHTQYGPHTV